MPPNATDHATLSATSFRNGGNAAIARQGTGSREVRGVTGTATSGMRLRNTRLIEPASALKRKTIENCHAAGALPSANAAAINAPKLPRLLKPASLARYFPRIVGGTRLVIHGNQPALEIPRERLNTNSSARIKTRRVVGSSNRSPTGTRAMPKIINTRMPQPPKTKRLMIFG